MAASQPFRRMKRPPPSFRALEHSDSGSGLPQSKQTFDTMMIACSEEIYENSVHIKIFEVPNLLLALRM